VEVILPLGSLAVAILLYGLRNRYRLLYGMFEIIVGIGGIHIILRPLVAGDSTIINSKTEELKWAAVIGGIYIIIRGMDNVYQGLSLQWRERWNCVFRKSQ
jgi:hypothetical protein